MATGHEPTTVPAVLAHDGVPDAVIVSYVAVDRPVYVVLTTPTAAGSGPLQAVADVLRQTMDTTDVIVR